MPKTMSLSTRSSPRSGVCPRALSGRVAGRATSAPEAATNRRRVSRAMLDSRSYCVDLVLSLPEMDPRYAAPELLRGEPRNEESHTKAIRNGVTGRPPRHDGDLRHRRHHAVQLARLPFLEPLPRMRVLRLARPLATLLKASLMHRDRFGWFTVFSGLTGWPRCRRRCVSRARR